MKSKTFVQINPFLWRELVTKKIIVLAGDGIGEEVMTQALRVLDYIKPKYHLDYTLTKGLIGGAAYDQYNAHFPSQTRQICLESDAILFGSVGGPIQDAHLPKWKNCEINSILALRKLFNLNANLRPARIYPELVENSPLKSTRIENGVDLLIVRELLGDLYFGEHKRFQAGNLRAAQDVAIYDEQQISIVAHQAFQAAQKRRGKLTSVDKANVLETSKLWREVVSEVAREYPNVKLEHMLVDNCAMQLLLNPSQFDVIVTSNMFGDILSDTAAGLPGSLGLMPSASLNQQGFGLYEPSGGSAPDIAGKDLANPIAQILSVAMLLQYTFELPAAAQAIEKAIQKALEAGYRTGDIYTPGTQRVGTVSITDRILDQLIHE
jgi:3-isopropylmalate dehydrogenase